jgi:hypothetical protein
MLWAGWIPAWNDNSTCPIHIFRCWPKGCILIWLPFGQKRYWSLRRLRCQGLSVIADVHPFTIFNTAEVRPTTCEPL